MHTVRDYTLPLVLLTLIAQLVFWGQTRHLRPSLAIVPEVPTVRAVQALSLGDPELYFRFLGIQLQNAGDTFGRVTALKDYNYADLSRWFMLLDTLDAKSNYIPALASYYYSQTQRKQDLRYIITYLEQHAMHDPQAKWWWLAQAVYLANHKLNDKYLALRLAEKLAAVPGDLPVWTRQMPAFIQRDLGENEEAIAIISGILKNSEHLGEGELNFMRYFIEERLNAIDPALLNEKKP